MIEQFKQWIFQGNPVLKVAILVLVIGIILLLRFATEHWQLSLAVKLAIVAGVSGAVTGTRLLDAELKTAVLPWPWKVWV